MLIFSILNHPYSLMVYDYHLFLILVNFYFQDFSSLKAILYVAQLTENTLTKPL